MTVAYYNAIEGYVSTNLEIAKGYAVAYDNAPFIIPEDETWMKLEIFDGIVGRASLGPQYMERSVGTVFITVYSPKSVGTLDARTAVDDVIEIFRSKQLATADGIITFYDATVKRIGEQYASGAGSSISSTVASVQWYAMLVQVAFKHDEVVVA